MLCVICNASVQFSPVHVDWFYTDSVQQSSGYYMYIWSRNDEVKQKRQQKMNASVLVNFLGIYSFPIFGFVLCLLWGLWSVWAFWTPSARLVCRHDWTSNKQCLNFFIFLRASPIDSLFLKSIFYHLEITRLFKESLGDTFTVIQSSHHTCHKSFDIFLGIVPINMMCLCFLIAFNIFFILVLMWCKLTHHRIELMDNPLLSFHSKLKAYNHSNKQEKWEWIKWTRNH